MCRMIVAPIFVGACIAAGACSGTQKSEVPATTSPPHSQPVADPDLDGLLLSPAEINTAMGVTGLTVTQSGTAMVDDSSKISATDCLSMVPGPQGPVYADSGWRAVVRHTVSEPGNNPAHLVAQAVVSFPAATNAAAFLTTVSRVWEDCAHRKFSDDRMVFSVSPIVETNGTLTATTDVSNGWKCGRALTVSDNVAIDITACGGSAPRDAAVSMAHQIADRVNQ